MKLWIGPIIILLFAVYVEGGKNNESSFFLNRAAFLRKNAFNTGDKIKGLMHTICYPNSIVISFDAYLMAHEMGIAPDQISLLDPKCRAKRNETHYVLTVEYKAGHMCQSEVNKDEYTVSNTLSVHPPSSDSIKVLEEMAEGNDSITSSREVEKIDGMYSGDSDYEELRSGDDSMYYIIDIALCCQYPKTNEEAIQPKDVEIPTLHIVEDDTFDIEFYRSETFAAPYRPGFQTIPENMVFYVQVIPSIESPYEKGTVRNCYFYVQGTMEREYIIKDGCPVGKGTGFYDSYQKGPDRRFKIRVKKYFNMIMLFRCEIEPCRLKTKEPQSLPQCESQLSYCLSKPTNSSVLIAVDWDFTVVVTPPGQSMLEKLSPLCTNGAIQEACTCQENGVMKEASSVSIGQTYHIYIIIASVISFAAGCVSSIVFCIIFKKVRKDAPCKMYNCF